MFWLQVFHLIKALALLFFDDNHLLVLKWQRNELNFALIKELLWVSEANAESLPLAANKLLKHVKMFGHLPNLEYVGLVVPKLVPN